MDPNGTRFHLRFGEADWRALLEEPGGAPRPGAAVWDAGRGAVTLAPRVFRFRRPAAEEPPRPEDRRGAGIDRWGTRYWIAEDRREIRYLPSGAPAAGVLWSVDELGRGRSGAGKGSDFRPLEAPPPPEAPLLRGLAVTGHHYLVAGYLHASGSGGLLVFDLHGGGPPVDLPWPEALAFAPLDLAPAPGGAVWVLDRAGAGAARLWRLDTFFRPVPLAGETELAAGTDEDFRPLEGKAEPPRRRPARTLPAGFAVDSAVASPPAPAAAVAVEGLPDGSALVLETGPGDAASAVHRFRGDAWGEPISLPPVPDAGPGPGRGVRGHDLAFLPGRPSPGGVAGELLVVDAEGNQAYAFRLDADADGLRLDLLPRYLPMRRFTGKALVVGPAGPAPGAPRIAQYDSGDRWLELVEQPRRRFAPRGVIEGLVLDGKEVGCVWHRLLLDGCIPDGASVVVESRAAESEALLEEALWRREPAPYLRGGGSELPFHRSAGAADGPGGERSGDGAGTWELLFQGAVGRRLELRITLLGDGRSAPSLHALRVYYPRFSYLREYLPAVYRDEPVSAHFLDRWLANAEGLFTALEGRIAGAEALFDHRTAPAGALDWLAGWLGAVLDPEWEEARRRLFLAHAELLFRWRGTLAGLEAAVRLATDPCPTERIFGTLAADGDRCGGAPPTAPGRRVRIVEHFLRRSFPGVALGDPTAPAAPAVIPEGAAWQPSHGAAPLHERFRRFLVRRHGGEAGALAQVRGPWGRPGAALAGVQLSPVVPANGAEAEDWLAFTRSGLGFTYAPMTAADAPRWRELLARRYRRVAELNRAYGLAGAGAWPSFEAVTLPAEDDFPEGGRRLADWIQLVSLALPVRANAHRFSVLVPVYPGEDRSEADRRLARAAAVVERERPAHTTFETALFLALFQVGTARLGLDTVVGEGSRFVAMSLGTGRDSGHLGGAFLAASHPWNVPERRVIGRDPLMEDPP